MKKIKLSNPKKMVTNEMIKVFIKPIIENNE